MDDLLGAVRLFAGNFIPQRYVACDGAALLIAEHGALFAVLGTTHGGDGVKTFHAPRLESPAPGLRYILCVDGIFPARS